jgi:hypothetical protein
MAASSCPARDHPQRERGTHGGEGFWSGGHPRLDEEDEDPEDEAPLVAQGPWTGGFGDAAPERLLGEPVSAQTDQFSLAVMAYELLTGRRPFAGYTVEEQLDLIRRQHDLRLREANPQVPEALAEVIERGLRYDPEERWPDLATSARNLERGLRQDLFEDATVELRPLFADPPRYLGRIASVCQ